MWGVTTVEPFIKIHSEIYKNTLINQDGVPASYNCLNKDTSVINMIPRESVIERFHHIGVHTLPQE